MDSDGVVGSDGVVDSDGCGLRYGGAVVGLLGFFGFGFVAAVVVVVG